MMEKSKAAEKQQQHVIDLMDALTLVVNTSDSIPASLYARIPHGRWSLRAATGLISRFISSLIRALPDRQRFAAQSHYLRALHGPEPENPASGRWLSAVELELVTSAIHKCCRSCTLDPQQQRQCPYAKMLDVMPTPTRKRGGSDGGCKYYI